MSKIDDLISKRDKGKLNAQDEAELKGLFKRVKAAHELGKLPENKQYLLEELPAPKEDIGYGQSLGAGALEGASFGWGDEIAGGAGALQDYAVDKVGQGLGGPPPGPIDYTGNRDAARDWFKESAEANPKTALMGELLGGAATGGTGVARSVGKMALKKALPKLIGEGAAIGSVAGAGYSEQEGLGGIAQDTAIGAGAGAVAAPLMAGAVKGATTTSHYFNPWGRQRKAARTLAGDLEDVGLTKATIAKELDANPNMVTADVDPGFQQRLNVTAGSSPPLARQANAQLAKRQAAQRGRIDDELNKVMKDTPMGKAAIDLTKRMREKAAPLYDEAYATQIVPNGKMYDVVSTPAGKRAVTAAVNRMKNKLDAPDPERINIKPDGTQTKVPDLSNMQLWDEVQRVLADKHHSLKNVKPALAKDYRNLADVVNDSLAEQSGAYKTARSIWRGGKADGDAMEMGVKAFNQRVPEVKAAYKKFSESEKWHFRVGVFEKVQDMISRKGEMDKLSTILKSTKSQDIVKFAFDDDQLFAQFKKVMGDESAMEETLQAVKNSLLIHTPDVYHAGITPANARQVGFRGTREVIHRGLGPLRRKEAEHIGGALLGRNPGKLLDKAGYNVGNVTAGVGGTSATLLPQEFASPLLPSAQPALPRVR